MAYKPKDQFFRPLVQGNVRTSGGSLSLATGELAIVNLNKTTKKGAQVISDFSQLGDEDKIAIRMGGINQPPSRTLDNKGVSTIPFRPSDVKKIYSTNYFSKLTVDDFVLGFNGEEGTGIDLDNGEAVTIQITLSGDAVGFYGSANRSYTFEVPIIAPNEGIKGDNWTVAELVEDAVKQFKEKTFIGDKKMTDLVSVTMVNSNNPATLPGTGINFYDLSVEDDGTYSAWGAVSAQYPDLDIKRKFHEDGITVYSVTAASSPGDFTFKSSSILKGCGSCPTGYTEVASGIPYEISLVDDNADSTATVQALPGAEAGTAAKIDNNGDTSVYIVTLEDELTEAEIDTFVSANPTAKVEKVGEDVKEYCEKAAKPSISWVQNGSCNFTTETYTIRLKDDICDETSTGRLAELEAAYPDLTIIEVADSNKGCARTYQTTVNTDLVCEECDSIYHDIFQSEAPEGYDYSEWRLTETNSYDGTEEVGIRVRGKEMRLGSGELMRDEVGFFNDSPEISLVAGFDEYENISYSNGGNDRVAVTMLSRKSQASNLGGRLRAFENEAIAFENGGNGRLKGHNYAKLSRGEETRLDPFKQYVVYTVVVVKHRANLDMEPTQNDAMAYHYPVELGRHEDLENLLNKLAVAAGVNPTQAVAK